jgi:hypothetical protein
VVDAFAIISTHPAGGGFNAWSLRDWQIGRRKIVARPEIPIQLCKRKQIHTSEDQRIASRPKNLWVLAATSVTLPITKLHSFEYEKSVRFREMATRALSTVHQRRYIGNMNVHFPYPSSTITDSLIYKLQNIGGS